MKAIYNAIAPEPLPDDGKIWGYITRSSAGTVRIATTVSDSVCTALEIDDVVVTKSRDQYLSAGEHIIKFTLANSTTAPDMFRSSGPYTKYILPLSITAIAANAFYSSNTLIVFDQSKIITIGSVGFRSCSFVDNTINMPNLTTLGSNAFQATTIKIVNNLGEITDLPSGCFRDATSLEQITIPSTVTSIGDYCFYGNVANKLTIICEATAPPTVGTSWVQRAPKAIKVPSASVATYQAASGWSTYSSIISAI